ncbi:DUF4362 domain-containing protein [Paenibacillus radicis (ex Gao et al. 2016)]|uniref:DUF4362 domain-containing protein n=1 Tax=Paenibacillus radicis (ex Gao et al. 2016) TaxID=1737354 RepID=A0A917HHH2_9BACL|nr:DUF4362 domain-containing protein [Paenibacillus radicis (ex Gao et al. 2016)]GGG78251.1 hypothetical protein GCM10010918_38920 [Paenibacillus radicis (ex Gao et al. 2016)]
MLILKKWGETLNNTKLTISILVVIIVLLITALVFQFITSRDQRNQKDEFVLHRMDQADVKRLDEMVLRHQEGKGDFLLVIPPIVDGGYWIHDIHSNGTRVTWTIDNTRDGMSGERGKQEFRCGTVSKQESEYTYDYVLNQCEGMGEEAVYALSVLKDIEHK